MNLVDKLKHNLDTPVKVKEKTPVEKLLDKKEVREAIQVLHLGGYSIKKITRALNIEYKGKLGVTDKESRSPRDDSVGTRETSTGATRYTYKVDNKITEPQVCIVLGIKHPLSK